MEREPSLMTGVPFPEIDEIAAAILPTQECEN